MIVSHQEAGLVWSVGYHKVIQSHSPMRACNLHTHSKWLPTLTNVCSCHKLLATKQQLQIYIEESAKRCAK